MIKAVIFDMDGVIIDSEPYHLIANKKIFKMLKINMLDSEYENYIGVPNSDMWNFINKSMY